MFIRIDSNNLIINYGVIRINPDKHDFKIFKIINKIHRHIKKSSKGSLIDDISKRVSELEFKSNYLIKSNSSMLFVKYCCNYKTCLLFKLQKAY